MDKVLTGLVLAVLGGAAMGFASYEDFGMAYEYLKEEISTYLKKVKGNPYN